MTLRIYHQDLLKFLIVFFLRDGDLCEVGPAGRRGRTQSAASERAARGDLCPPLLPLGGRRHRGDKVVDDREAVG